MATSEDVFSLTILKLKKSAKLGQPYFMFRSQAITLFSEKLLFKSMHTQVNLAIVQSSGKSSTHEKANSTFKIIFKSLVTSH